MAMQPESRPSRKAKYLSRTAGPTAQADGATGAFHPEMIRGTCPGRTTTYQTS